MKFNAAVSLLASSSLIENVSSKPWSRSGSIMDEQNQLPSGGLERSIPREPLRRRMQSDDRPGIKLSNHRAQECIPKSMRIGRVEPGVHDVGILECDVNELCLEEERSSLGGFCVSETNSYSRGLQEYYTEYFIGTDACNPNLENFYECDCSDFDPATERGSFSCVVYENFCFPNGVCGDFLVRSEISETESKTNYCYSFVEPFSAEFCYEIREDNSCQIIINGESCASCAIVDIENTELGYTMVSCFAFDCTNTIAQSAGNDCLGTSLLDGVFPVGSQSTLPPAYALRNKTLPASNMPSMMPSTASSKSPIPLDSQSPSIQIDLPSQIAPFSLAQPSASSTDSPTTSPTESPTGFSTSSPSKLPTKNPTKFPTASPTEISSIEPTVIFSVSSAMPSADPTVAPVDAGFKSIESPKPTPFPSLSSDFPRRDPPIESVEGSAASSRGTLSNVSLVLQGLVLAVLASWTLAIA